MLKKIKNLTEYILPSKNIFQNILFVGCILMFFLYSLSIPLFAKQYNFIPIVIVAAMAILIGLYVFLFGSIKINVLVALLILFNISTLITHTINKNFKDLEKTIILMSIVAILVYELVSNYKNPNLFFVMILITGIIFSIVYIDHYSDRLFDFSKIFENRLGRDFDNENEISKEFGFFAVLSIAVATKSNKTWLKILSYFSTILFIFLILTTGSISNLLTSVLISCVTLIWFQKNTKRKIIVASIIIGILVLLIIMINLPFMSYFKTRIDNIFTTLFNPDERPKDGSASDRFNGAITSFAIGFNRLIFGFGYMSATNFTYLGIQSHNNFAELFIDFGIVGLFIYELLIYLPLSRSIKNNSKHYIISLCLYMFVFQLFLTTYYKKFEYIFLGCMYGALDSCFKTKCVIHDSTKKESKKTLIYEIIPSLTPVGGAETFISDFIKTVHKKYGNTVDVKLIILYKQPQTHLLKELSDIGIEIIQLDKRRGMDFRCSMQLRELILRDKPDVIHTHLLTISTLFLAIPFKTKKIKKYHTIHHNFSKDDKNHKLLKFLFRRNYLLPICVAKTPTEQYKKYLDKDLICINNGIVLSRYNNSVPLAKREIDFLVVGRFVNIKNQKYLIRLYSSFKDLRKYGLVFVGDGPDIDECKKMVSNYKLTKYISFVGFSNDVPDFMSKSKVLVIPSKNEGNPIVINEAIASGMLVVGNDVGGIHDLLFKNKNGLLSNISNKNEFVSKLIIQIQNANKIETVVKQSLKKYDIETTVKMYMDLFLEKNV